MKVIYMGTPEHATYPLEKLLSEGYNVIGVYTQPDRESGRGRQTKPSPVKVLAKREGLNILQPKSLREKTSIATLSELNPDIIVICAYGIILPPAILEIPKAGTINIHPSMLPLYRGPSPVSTAIIKGDHLTGVTIMEVDEGTDTGPVIAQQKELITDEDTTDTLTRRLFKKGANLLTEQIPSYYDGKTRLFIQNEQRATYTKKLTKDIGVVDWNQPAISLWRQIRAYTSWPGSYTMWKNKRVKLLDVWPSDLNTNTEVGTVVVNKTEKIIICSVQTGKGSLILNSLQIEGKQPTTIEDFINGHPDFTKANLDT